MQFRDNLEIPGGNTRRQTKVEVGLGYCSYRRQVLKLVREMVFKGEHGRNHDCKRINTQILDDIISRKYLLLQEASMIGSTSCPWA